MVLKAKPPEKISKRLKMFVYGAAGSGKTTAAIQFPKPYVIDTEKGTENDSYVDLINQAGGAVLRSSDYDDVYNEVRALLSEKHDYKTLVIDSLTTIYDDLLEKSANKLKSANDLSGTSMARHYGEANKKMKSLINMLLRLDMNIIITSHSKNEYAANMTLVGQTFDCYKKIDYLFDLVLEVKRIGNNVSAIVRKTRCAPYFVYDDIFAFNYDEMTKRYGEELFAKNSEPESLASAQQIEDLTNLLEKEASAGRALELKSKWLEKAKCDSFEDMTSDIIQKCIDFRIALTPKQSQTGEDKNDNV